MRFVYVLLTYLVIPVVMAFEGWKAITQPEYRGRLGQRLGFVRRVARPGCVWLHAVSVGEVQAAAGLVQELRRRHPGLMLVVSTVTPTGAQRARALFKDTVQHCYLPYDLPGSVRRFLDRIEPQVAIILETEIWPTLYGELARRGIPLVLGSARLSMRSVGRYRRLASLLRDTLSHGIFVGAQTPADAERFRMIGAPAERVHVSGNIKYDLEIPLAQVAAGRALRAAWGATRPVWIAGSTHEGEEDAALAAHAAVRATHPDALLLLVPRHPQRFDAVRQLLARRGIRYQQRSKGLLPAPDDAVFLVDSLGELQMLYAATDIAFVGGSLVPIGGHNLLEPAVLGLPILSGPHTQNGQDIAELLVQCGALRLVAGQEELGAALLRWFGDPAGAQGDGERGRRAVAANRGAVDRLVALIEPLLRSSDGRPGSSSAVSGNH
jgi:3-deoxy-D-manno-octulosonic-acid transferase